MTKNKWDYKRGAKIGFKTFLLAIPAMIVSSILGLIVGGVIGLGAVLSGQAVLGVGLLTVVQWVIGFTIFGMFLWRYWTWVKKDEWF